MIEVKHQFRTIADLVAFYNCLTEPARSNVGEAYMQATAQIEQKKPSATVTPEKQQAARDSTAPGKVEKAVKAAKALAPADKNPETPVEALAQAIAKDEPVAEETKKSRDYQTSGIPEKIARATQVNKAGVIAALTEHKGVKADGKLSGAAVPPDNLDAFEAAIDAILAG